MVRLNEGQLALQARARILANEAIAPRAADVDRSEAYPWDNVKALKDAGFFGLTIPEAYGGPGLGYLEASLVIEEMAKVCGVTGRIALSDVTPETVTVVFDVDTLNAAGDTQVGLSGTATVTRCPETR